jgi:AraC-like DNA-binding protein
MDVLSEVLRAVRLTGAIFFDMRFHSPWVGQSPDASAIAGSVMPEAEHVINFHALLEGSCWAELVEESAPAVRLNAGDVIIYPMGDANVLCSSPGMRADPNLAIYYRPNDRQLPFVLHQTGSGTETCHFVCGYLGCDLRPFNPLLGAMPRMLHARKPTDGKDWVAQLIRLAVDESESNLSGGETILAKVSELMFVDILRHYIDTLPEGSQGWLSGVRDEHVGAALRLIHAYPAKAWTIERLAREVGLSRSAFAERFVHYVRIAPMTYLGRWRMQLAARLLGTPSVSVGQVGAEVGYESEAAFNRAFKKFVGTTPGAWRKARTTPASASSSATV